tara:strand:+ start:34 stop:672 length:639 start_codon:yes stop_codon:yes gene_type:complete
MGYDVYGISPQLNKEHSTRYDEIMKEYGTGDGFLDWQKKIPEEIKEEYYELTDKFNEDNPGVYFRNNVWFWRPLWNFVCNNCEDILDDDDMMGGGTNDGYEISEYKAQLIGKRLSALLADGTVDEADRINTLERARAKSHNDEIKEQQDEIRDEVHKKFGKDVVPANYPEPYYKKWHDLQNKEIWSAHYPFDKENVRNFAKFCLESGGFSIC